MGLDKTKPIIKNKTVMNNNMSFNAMEYCLKLGKMSKLLCIIEIFVKACLLSSVTLGSGSSIPSIGYHFIYFLFSFNLLVNETVIVSH